MYTKQNHFLKHRRRFILICLVFSIDMSVEMKRGIANIEYPHKMLSHAITEIIFIQF